MNPAFVHLRLHTEYSLVDSLVRIKPLMKAAAEAGMPALALTDHTNLFAMVKFYKAAQGAGIKPIIGCDVWIGAKGDEAFPMTLLCRTQQGYRNLAELISQGYAEGQREGRAHIDPAWLEGRSDGLIALSGGRLGDVGQALLAEKRPLAEARLNRWRALFPDAFYLELTRTGRLDEERYLHAAIELAAESDTPVVATNDVRFLKAEEFDAHEVRVCINQGYTLDDPRRPKNYSPEQYLRTAEEMGELFADIPEALENSVEIAKRCTVEFTFGTYYLPDFPIPDGMTMDDYFRHLSREGLDKRLKFLFDEHAADFAEISKPYWERLEIELDVIISMGFPGYFLIVADFIQWGKNNGVPVGPGRGSGAGSLVAYALTITDLDPIKYELLFERFLNPERVSMPDFDVDFCMEGRDRVIDYVAQKYGREKVSQIITYGSMAAKAVVRDVGRVLGHGYGFVDAIAKLIPFDLGMTLTKALEAEEALRERYENDEEVGALIDMALQLEGLTRGVGKHAGGVVIGPSKLTDFTPLYCDEAGGGVVSQFDKNDVEEVGLVKFDFLGLRTLTIIDWALDNIESIKVERPVIERIPLDDKPTFDLLKRCETTAVFQLESRGMKEIISRLLPDNFEDIVALVALFRPGPLQSGMVDNFINRKHGREEISYPDAQYQHEWLKTILEPTYGIILYQEQVMQIAQVLAGYSLGGADLLRRAMGKKKPEEMAKQRAVFQEGAEKLGVDGDLAMKIFDLVEKFAGYGFNKSHSAAYALVSYQTAWLKQHYPAPFMAAVLSSDMDNTDKVVTFIDECERMGLKVEPPDVNCCDYKFTVSDMHTVIYGLGAVKGVGEGAIEGIVESRKADGPFSDLFEFCRRVDTKKLNRRALEALIRAGALDALHPEKNRNAIIATLEAALKLAEQHARDEAAGQFDLFGAEDGSSGADEPAASYVEMPMWSLEERLQGEKETLGLYLTGHPIDPFREELSHFTSCRLADLPADPRGGLVLSGMVLGVRTRVGQRGKMAFVTLDDKSGRFEIPLFSDNFERFGHLLIKDAVLVVVGDLAKDDYSGGMKLRPSNFMNLDEARNLYAKAVVIKAGPEQLGTHQLKQLGEAISTFANGKTPIQIEYSTEQAAATLRFGEQFSVIPTETFLGRVRGMFGEECVRLEYR